MEPTVSVIIPTFNRMDLIPETICSVLAQTFEDFEILVIDNGSSDNTAEVVKKINDPRIRYYWQEPSGAPAHPRNAGLRMARGEYICFLDSDDLWLPDKLESQLRLFKQHPDLKWVYSKTDFFEHETGQTIGKKNSVTYHKGDICGELIKSNFIASPTPLVKRSVFEEVGGFNEKATFFAREDWELWLRIASRYPIGFVPRVLTKYRVHSGAISSNKEFMIKKYYGTVATICSATSFAPQKYEKFYLDALRRQVESYAKYFILNGDKLLSRKILNQYLAQRQLSGSVWCLKLISMLPANVIIYVRKFMK